LEYKDIYIYKYIYILSFENI